MATVLKKIRPGVSRRVKVKNLGWFFRKARLIVIERFDFYQANDGWEMIVEFADGNVFETHYESLSVFKSTMKRQKSLKGYSVKIHREDGNDLFEI